MWYICWSLRIFSPISCSFFFIFSSRFYSHSTHYQCFTLYTLTSYMIHFLLTSLFPFPPFPPFRTLKTPSTWTTIPSPHRRYMPSNGATSSVNTADGCRRTTLQDPMSPQQSISTDCCKFHV